MNRGKYQDLGVAASLRLLPSNAVIFLHDHVTIVSVERSSLRVVDDRFFLVTRREVGLFLVRVDRHDDAESNG